MENFICEINNFLCEYNGILTAVFCVAVCAFVVSIYTCFIKCRRIQKNIDSSNLEIQRFSSNQKVIENCLRQIEGKISSIEKRLDSF